MQDPRVNPSSLNNKALKLASASGHIEIVKLFQPVRNSEMSEIESVSYQNGQFDIYNILRINLVEN